MRFALGLAIGFGVGFAGALLFAPDRSRGRQVDRPAGPVEGGPAALEEDADLIGAVKRVLRSLQEQVDQALTEAKKAQKETEREMLSRYETTARRKVGEEGK